MTDSPFGLVPSSAEHPASATSSSSSSSMSFLSRLKGSSKSSSKSTPNSPNPGSSSSSSSSSSKPLPVLTPLKLSLPSPSLLDSESPSTSSTTPSSNRNGVPKSSSGSTSSSAWIKVDPTSATAPGLTGEERRKLDRSMFAPEQVTELVALLGQAIKSKGLTTLGLMRPFRTKEDERVIFSLEKAWVDYTDAQKDVFAEDKAVELKTKAALDAFKEEVKWAGVHDIVAVLKWGFRHLVYPGHATFSGSPTTSTVPPLAFYTSFHSQALSSPSTTSFSQSLLPSLPATSSHLLATTLDLMSSIVAHAEENAMSSRSLSLKLGIYLFGLNNPNVVGGRSKDFDHGFYADFVQAGTVLEGLLKAYLKELDATSPLPKRLKEVIGTWPSAPPPSSSSSSAAGTNGTGSGQKSMRSVRVLKVQLESKGEWDDAVQVNDQATGVVSGASGKRKFGVGGSELGERKFARRDPLVVLGEAFAATKHDKVTQDDEAKEIWTFLIATAKDDPKSILSDETTRVLNLVGLGQVPLSKPASPKAPNSPASSTTRRRRSFSQDASLTALAENGLPHSTTASPFLGSDLSGGYGGFGNFPNKSVGNLGVTSSSVTSNWNDFALEGFGKEEPFSSGEFGLIQPTVGSPALGRPPGRSKTLGGTRPGPAYKAPDVLEEPKVTLVRVELIDMDEELKEVWLDTLNDRLICQAWPSFLISDLRPSLSPRVEYLLVVEKLVGLGKVERPLAKPTLARAPSISESTMSRSSRWRVSGLFSSASISAKSRRAASSDDAMIPTASIATLARPTKEPLAALQTTLPPLASSPPVSPRKKRSKQSVPTIPESPVKTSFAPKDNDGDAASITSTSSRKSFIRRLSISKKTSNKSLNGAAAIPDVPSIPTAYSLPSIDISSSPKAESHALPVSILATGAAAVGVTGAAAGWAAMKTKPDTSKALPDMPIAPEVELPPASNEAITPTQMAVQEPKGTSSTTELPAAVNFTPEEHSKLAASAQEAPLPAPPLTLTDAASTIIDVPSVLEQPAHEEHVIKNAEVPIVMQDPIVQNTTPIAAVEVGTESRVTEKELEHDRTPAVSQQMVEEEPTSVIDSVQVAPSDLGKGTTSTEDADSSIPSSNPTFSISPPAIDEQAIEKDSKLARTISEETIHGSTLPAGSIAGMHPSIVEENAAVVREVQDSPIIAAPPAEPSPSTLAQPEYQSYPMDSPTIPLQSTSPSTPQKSSLSSILPPSSPTSPSLSAEAPLSPALSTTSDTSTVGGTSSAPGSPSSQNSRKFLGSKAIGGLLRRKKSSLEKSASVDKVTDKEELKALKQRQKEDKAELKKAVPVPVSSVKKRVKEIEEEAAAATAAKGPESTALPPLSASNKSVSPTPEPLAVANPLKPASEDQGKSLAVAAERNGAAHPVETLAEQGAVDGESVGTKAESAAEPVDTARELKNQSSEHSLAETSNTFQTADSEHSQ